MTDLTKLLMVGSAASGVSWATCWFGDLLFGTAGAAVFGVLLAVSAFAFLGHELRRPA